MSKINGLPDSVNYLYGAEIGEPIRHDLFRRPAEDYADLAELEMIAGCIGCHDSDDQSILTVEHSDHTSEATRYFTGGFVTNPAIDGFVGSDAIGAAPAWLVADAPEDYDEVMNEIPRAPKLIRQVCLGIALFWIVAFFLLTWAVA